MRERHRATAQTSFEAAAVLAFVMFAVKLTVVTNVTFYDANTEAVATSWPTCASTASCPCSSTDLEVVAHTGTSWITTVGRQAQRSL